MHPTFSEYVHRLLHVPEQSRVARTVEWFGWLMLLESPFLVIVPRRFLAFLHLPDPGGEFSAYVRLAGGLLCVVGMLYVFNGRLNSRAFVFASLLDRPLVPIVMGVLWWLGRMPGPLALGFSIQDFGTFLWTVMVWRAERSTETTLPTTPSPALQ